MENKTKFRIVGGIAVIVLVILCLPMLRTESNLSSQTTVLKAPPFPDQAIQTSSNVIDQNPVQSNIAQESPVIPVIPEHTNPEPIQQASAPVSIEPKPMQVESVSTPSQILSDLEQSLEKETMKKPLANNPREQSPTIKRIRSSRPLVSQLNVDKNGLLNLKSPSYVVQLGTFREKEHAIRLVNQLRKSGYNAFIQQYSANTIQVFVGPENKHKHAKMIADQIKSDMHLQGMIISYQPFNL